MVLSNNNNARQHNVLLSQSDFSQTQTNDYLLSLIIIYLFYCSLSIAICLYATGSLNDVGRCSSVYWIAIE